MGVFALMADDIAQHLVCDFRHMLQRALNVVTQAVERQACTLSTKGLVDDLAHPAAQFAAMLPRCRFAQIREQLGLPLGAGCFHEIQETQRDQTAVDRNDPF